LAASKVAAEFLGLQAWLGTRLEVVVVRPFNHVGPDQSADMVVPAIAQRMLDARAAGKRTVPVGNVDARRDYTDVRDIVRAYRELALRGEPGQAYNVCSGKDVSVGEIAARLGRTIGLDVELSVDPSLVRPREVEHLRGDPMKARERTGWEPGIDLDQMLADVVAWRRRGRAG
jgi:GDP-4-dehydro-6-deoxy-D-mannose reductase